MATTRVSSTASAVAGRAVHIKIHPRPRNISESRQVLRVLERYGEVVMYKHLKVYDFIFERLRRYCLVCAKLPYEEA